MTESVSDEQAQEVLDAIVASYHIYFEPMTSGKSVLPPYEKPVLRRDERGHAVIWWEDGPSDWAYQVTEGGSTEEDRVLIAQANEEFGGQLRPAEPKQVQFPAGVMVEPYTSYAVGVYPA